MTAPPIAALRFARTPPAIFPPILGLLGLGLAWRTGLTTFALPPAAGEMLLGAACCLFLWALTALMVKIARRPAVLSEDLRILPGRAGIGAAVISVYAFAGALAPYAPDQARPILLLGIALHAAVAVLLVRHMILGPAPARVVTPVWHLNFTGVIVGGLIAEALGLMDLAFVMFLLALPAALAIWAVSLEQVRRESVPAPLRPLLAIHSTPANYLGFVALGLGWHGVAQGFALLTAAMALAGLAGARWLTAGGFSPLWGAFTFPLTTMAAYWLSMGGVWRWPGLAVLLACTVIVPWIAFGILRMWPDGRLAARTNAATA
ncbi:TDT family transporter [Frigidibacter oleivorans]|uniref:SLAC1 family transporter n=1 Tax=Frigidibacter oleivorans TaxID=2487129 RepID=UPI001F231768|nr:tellurium resistance protein [Frigidibacter oleivorans]